MLMRVLLLADRVDVLEALGSHRLFGKLLDVLRHCRREEQCLTVCRRRKLVQNLTDLRHEPHLKKLVSFVKDKDSQVLRKRLQAVILKVVVEPARGGHQDVWRVLQPVEVLGHLLPPDDAQSAADSARPGVETAEMLGLLLDLLRELAGRRHDERRDLVGAVRQSDFGDHFKRRHQKGQRLPRPGLGLREDVQSIQDGWERLALDLGGKFVTQHLGKRPLRVWMDREVGEAHVGELGLGRRRGPGLEAAWSRRRRRRHRRRPSQKGKKGRRRVGQIQKPEAAFGVAVPYLRCHVRCHRGRVPRVRSGETRRCRGRHGHRARRRQRHRQRCIALAQKVRVELWVQGERKRAQVWRQKGRG
mmetsp:Transcript_1034/g.3489  ORF Transcript_1034/g.3489 Transcript_1034/m.3489 type:complete len:359 (-) Transcript_1034:413-1489(-)